MLNKTKFKAVFDDNRDYFVTEISRHDPKTLSDLDEATYKVMEKCLEEKKFMDYKEVAFQNGVVADLLIKVYSIYIREQLTSDFLPEAPQNND